MCALLLIGFSLFFPAFALSQDEGDQRDSDADRNRGAQYFLGEQDELLIKVNIWGFVRRPGQYMVPKDTDLISLISFAGGPLEQAKVKKVKIIRAVTPPTATNGGAHSNDHMLASPVKQGNVSVKTNSPQAERVLEVNIKKYLETGQSALVPELKPGDTIVVPGNTFHFLGKVMDFATKFAVLAQIYFWVNIAQR